MKKKKKKLTYTLLSLLDIEPHEYLNGNHCDICNW